MGKLIVVVVPQRICCGECGAAYKFKRAVLIEKIAGLTVSRQDEHATFSLAVGASGNLA